MLCHCQHIPSVPVAGKYNANGKADMADYYHEEILFPVKHVSLSPLRSSLKTSVDEKPVKTVSFSLPPDEAHDDGETWIHNGYSASDEHGADTNLPRSPSPGGGSGTIRDMEAAKQAVVFMDIPEDTVQLVIDARDLDPDTTFTDVQQLYLVAEAVALNPDLQARLRAKVKQRRGAEEEAARERKAASSVLNDKQGLEHGEKTGAGAPANAEQGDCCQKPLTGMSEDGQSHNQASAAVSPLPCDDPATRPHPAKTGAGEFRKEDEDKVKVNDTPAARDENEENDDENNTTLTPSAQPGSWPNTGRPPVAGDGGGEGGGAVGGESAHSKDATKAAAAKDKVRQKLHALQAENRRLKHRKFCRACREVDLGVSGVTFLPCGHFITCEKCSEKFDDCPACGRAIMGTVRTFLS